MQLLTAAGDPRLCRQWITSSVAGGTYLPGTNSSGDGGEASPGEPAVPLTHAPAPSNIGHAAHLHRLPCPRSGSVSCWRPALDRSAKAARGHRGRDRSRRPAYRLGSGRRAIAAALWSGSMPRRSARGSRRRACCSSCGSFCRMPSTSTPTSVPPPRRCRAGSRWTRPITCPTICRRPSRRCSPSSRRISWCSPSSTSGPSWPPGPTPPGRPWRWWRQPSRREADASAGPRGRWLGPATSRWRPPARSPTRTRPAWRGSACRASGSGSWATRGSTAWQRRSGRCPRWIHCSRSAGRALWSRGPPGRRTSACSSGHSPACGRMFPARA